ncbi:hypothetical protein HG530_009259 [Fusarium avenaceum]|nr:hypothetical protein HG530_009259 [Fusarium avenaceum]
MDQESDLYWFPASFNATGSIVAFKAGSLLGADLGVQVDGAGAAVNPLHAGGAVALGIAGLAVELLTTLTGAQDVVLVGEGVAELGAELVCGKKLTVDVVGLGLGGVAEEQRLGKSLGGGDLDGRSGSADVLRESLSGLDSGQGAGSTSAVGEGLDVDGAGAVVDDNGLVGGGSSAEDGSESSEGAELHDGGLVGLGLGELKTVP